MIKPIDVEAELSSIGATEIAREAGINIRTPLEKALDAVISGSPLIIAAKEKASKLSRHSLSVLITGETGTGKELFARILHGNRQGKFIAVNCGGIPDTLVESEFFGCEKGAFTGAFMSRKGYFEEAEGGTIFLDEIAELDRSLQSKLLRVIQEKAVNRLGSTDDIPVNCRVVSATNHSVEELRSNNKLFRLDLFYRLAGSIIHLVPLRERGSLEGKLDAELICEKKLVKYPEELKNNPWSGNVRELLNYIEEQKALI